MVRGAVGVGTDLPAVAAQHIMVLLGNLLHQQTHAAHQVSPYSCSQFCADAAGIVDGHNTAPGQLAGCLSGRLAGAGGACGHQLECLIHALPIHALQRQRLTCGGRNHSHGLSNILQLLSGQLYSSLSQLQQTPGICFGGPYLYTSIIILLRKFCSARKQLLSLLFGNPQLGFQVFLQVFPGQPQRLGPICLIGSSAGHLSGFQNPLNDVLQQPLDNRLRDFLRRCLITCNLFRGQSHGLHPLIQAWSPAQACTSRAPSADRRQSPRAGRTSKPERSPA